MVLNSKNSGKYLSNDWSDKQHGALRDLDQRETLTTFEKEYIELTDREIGSQDPDNFKLTEKQKRNRGM